MRLLRLLLAPLLFYLHTTFVLGILRGRVTPWISPSRNPGETLPLRTAVQMFWVPGILALGLTALAWWLVSSFLVYLLAIIVGWVIAIPLATGSSRPLKAARMWTEQTPAEDQRLVTAARRLALAAGAVMSGGVGACLRRRVGWPLRAGGRVRA